MFIFIDLCFVKRADRLNITFRLFSFKSPVYEMTLMLQELFWDFHADEYGFAIPKNNI